MGTDFGGASAPSGGLGLTLIRRGGQRQTVHAEPRWPTIAPSLADIRRYGMPHRDAPAEVNAWRRSNLPNLWRGMRRVLPARAARLPHFYGQLWLTVFRDDGEVLDLGLASLRVVTDTGVKFIVDDFNANAQDVTNMKFHGFGTGAGTELATNTA